ncbi:hypothetical protein ACNQR7_26965 [Mycolicibacterium senegalense]|uniref:hypothetical protein n=1 Tax=Mycolicibacterium TaxID=1866885 RepID=UPI003204911F
MSQTMRAFLDEVEAQTVAPEREEAVRILNEAQQKLASFMAPIPDGTVDLHPFTSGAVTDEWLDAAVRRQQLLDEHRAKENVLRSFIKEVGDWLQSMKPDPSAALRKYSDRLGQLLDEATELVDVLGEVRTPQAAIDAGRATEWAQLCNLSRDYTELRAAQDEHTPADVKTRARALSNADPHASDTYIRNLDDIWPSWRHPAGTPRTTYLDGRPDDPAEPWPQDPVQLLIWLVTSNAEPWIPTLKQLQRLWAERADRQNPATNLLGERSAQSSTVLNPYDGMARYEEMQQRQYGQAKVIKSVPTTQGASF